MATAANIASGSCDLAALAASALGGRLVSISVSLAMMALEPFVARE